MSEYETIHELEVKKVDNGYIVTFRVPFTSYTLVVNSLTRRKLKEVLCDIIDGDYIKYVRSAEREEWAERKEWEKKAKSSGGDSYE